MQISKHDDDPATRLHRISSKLFDIIGALESNHPIIAYKYAVEVHSYVDILSEKDRIRREAEQSAEGYANSRQE